MLAINENNQKVVRVINLDSNSVTETPISEEITNDNLGAMITIGAK